MDNGFTSNDKDKAEEAATRGGARDSMLLSALLRRGHGEEGEPVEVRVRNISSGGLMAETVLPLQREDPVSIDLRGVGVVDGYVAWALEGRVGIAFTVEIDPRRTRKPVAGAKRDDFYTQPAAIRSARRPTLRTKI